MRRLLACAALMTTLAQVAGAQSLPPPAGAQNATLVSDRLEITDKSVLVASGNVEALFQGRRLKAHQIRYDQDKDQLFIQGPLTLTEADGSFTILASSAELSGDMSEGLIQSARMVMDQQLQMAAGQITRSQGRYTTLHNVITSSCRVCATSQSPLWEIRARTVVHDQEEQQIYFKHAVFRIAGVPAFYLPNLRIPDPSLERSNGFLAPTLRTTSDLGTGLKLPYFITMGQDKDLTLTPYLTTTGSKTLELRYRQAFNTGSIEFNGAVSHDNLTDDEQRGYLFANGAFDLPRDFTLTFGLQVASDNSYLLDYGYSDSDRLDSRIQLQQVRRNGYFSTKLVSFQSLRDDEDNDTIPSLIADATYHRRFSLGAIAGEGGFLLQSNNNYRTSNHIHDDDGDGIADGRDTNRLSARFDWRKSAIFDPGVELTALGEAQIDTYRIRQDDVYGGDVTRGHSAVGLELRWPWVKAASSGATYVIEPIVQMIWANGSRKHIPNEDSSLAEFDEGNLFAINRYPGFDAVDPSSRSNIGVTWTRYDPAGWNIGLTMGRILRQEDYNEFGSAYGWGRKRSDWLTAATLSFANGFQATGRMVFGDGFDLSLGEMRLAKVSERFSLTTSVLWSAADSSFSGNEPSEEFAFSALWHVNDRFSASAKGSYDFGSERGTLGAIGMEFRNECVAVDLSLSRRLTRSDSVNPTTSFGLTVDLIGFGGRANARATRQCF